MELIDNITPVMYTDPSGLMSWPAFGNWLKSIFIDTLPDLGRFMGGLAITLLSTVATCYTASSFLIPVLSSVPLFTANMAIYGTMLMASAFSNPIKSDMQLIGWNPFNSNAAAAANSNNISFYKGVFMFKYGDSNTGTGFSFGIVGLGRGLNADSVRHEYGHHKQQRLMGLLLYTPIIALPSLIHPAQGHSDLWFERWATAWGNSGWFWWL